MAIKIDSYTSRSSDGFSTFTCLLPSLSSLSTNHSTSYMMITVFFYFTSIASEIVVWILFEVNIDKTFMSAVECACLALSLIHI